MNANFTRVVTDDATYDFFSDQRRRRLRDLGERDRVKKKKKKTSHRDEEFVIYKEHRSAHIRGENKNVPEEKKPGHIFITSTANYKRRTHKA